MYFSFQKFPAALCQGVFPIHKNPTNVFYLSPTSLLEGGGGGGTLGMFWWECAAGTLEPLAHTRASSAEFWYSIAILD